MTIVLGFPKSVVKEPSLLQKFLWKYGKFWPFLIPFFLFIYLFEEWWRKGKDPKVKKPIIARYQPPEDLRPAQLGLIMRQKVEGLDVSATIIDLAVRGYIKIREVEKPSFLGDLFRGKDYEIVRLDPELKSSPDSKEDLLEYENKLLKILFDSEKKILLSRLEEKYHSRFNTIFDSQKKVLLSHLKKKFYSQLKNVRNKIYESVAPFHYFVSKNPETVRGKWMMTGLVIIILSGLFAIESELTPIFI
jgi:plasmid maintenance system killer protein